jgi:hypothetical protein
MGKKAGMPDGLCGFDAGGRGRVSCGFTRPDNGRRFCDHSGLVFHQPGSPP